MREIKDFYEAWHFLYSHPIFQSHLTTPGLPFDIIKFRECLYVAVFKVNPKTGQVKFKQDPETGEKIVDGIQNTEMRIRLECGPWFDADSDRAVALNKAHPGTVPSGGMFSHDTDLDCVGKTFEEAILGLANLVLKKYDDYHPEPTPFFDGGETGECDRWENRITIP